MSAPGMLAAPAQVITTMLCANCRKPRHCMKPSSKGQTGNTVQLLRADIATCHRIMMLHIELSAILARTGDLRPLDSAIRFALQQWTYGLRSATI